MKKILITSTYCTANLSVGSERVRLLVQGFVESGFNVTWLVPESVDADLIAPAKVKLVKYVDHYKVMRTVISGSPLEVKDSEFKNKSKIQSIRNKLLQSAKVIFAIPDPFVFWIFPAGLKLLRLKYIDKADFDLIISSSNPKTPHLIGFIAKKIFKAKWIMEYRDFWTNDHYYEKTGFVAFLERKLEKLLLKSSTCVVTVSEQYAERMRAYSQKDVYTIYNAFDNLIINKEPYNLHSKFTITYSGNLANLKRDPKILFEALSELVEEGEIDKSKLSVSIIGKDSKLAYKSCESSDIKECLECFPYMDRNDVLEYQRMSHILLIIFWNHPVEVGVVTGKFEYFAALRKIFAINGQPNGVMKHILEKTKSGIYFDIDDKESLKRELLVSYKNYVARNDGFFCNTEEDVEYVSQRAQLQRYLKVIQAL